MMDEVQKKAADAAASWIHLMMETVFNDVAPIGYESKIEELMAYGMRTYSAFTDSGVCFNKVPNKTLSEIRDCSFADDITVYPQVKIGAYRVDFLIAIRLAHGRRTTGGKAFIAIECDGHEFHERTKEQAQRDKERDRIIASHQIQVRRYTGSEIWSDPMGCGSDAIEAAKSIYVDDLYEWHASNAQSAFGGTP